MAFSNGIVGLAILAMLILVIIRAKTP